MAELVVEVKKRPTGKNESRRLRRDGLVPAILYGEGKEPVPISVELRAMHAILHSEKGRNTVFDLAMSETGQRRPAMVKDFQVDPVVDRLVHCDFIRISADHEVHITVHVELVGTAVGVKTDGGIMDFTTREVTVACLPKDIPASLAIDVSELRLGQVLRVADLTLPEGVKALTDDSVVICGVHAPQKEEAPVAAAAVEGAAAATPEAAAAAGKPEEEKKGGAGKEKEEKKGGAGKEKEGKG